MLYILIILGPIVFTITKFILMAISKSFHIYYLMCWKDIYIKCNIMLFIKIISSNSGFRVQRLLSSIIRCFQLHFLQFISRADKHVNVSHILVTDGADMFSNDSLRDLKTTAEEWGPRLIYGAAKLSTLWPY